jgi:hypothetical protein
MSEIEFEWDPRKDRANQAKHGVSFSEAATAFYDENGYLLDDPDHSAEEDHFVLPWAQRKAPLARCGPLLQGPGCDDPHHLGPKGQSI